MALGCTPEGWSILLHAFLASPQPVRIEQLEHAMANAKTTVPALTAGMLEELRAIFGPHMEILLA